MAGRVASRPYGQRISSVRTEYADLAAHSPRSPRHGNARCDDGYRSCQLAPLETASEGWQDAAMDTGKAAHEARALEEVVERLVGRFPDVTKDRVREIVTAAHQEFADRPIRDFVPVFVERKAREELSRSTTE